MSKAESMKHMPTRSGDNQFDISEFASVKFPYFIPHRGRLMSVTFNCVRSDVAGMMS